MIYDLNDMFLFKMYFVVSNLILVCYCLPLSGDPFRSVESTFEPNVETKPVNNADFSGPNHGPLKVTLFHTSTAPNSHLSRETSEGPILNRQSESPPGTLLGLFYADRKKEISTPQIFENIFENSNLEKSQTFLTTSPFPDFAAEETPNPAELISNIPEVSAIYQRHGHCRSTKPFTRAIFVVDRCPWSAMDPWLMDRCHHSEEIPYRHPDCVIEIDHIPVQDAEGIVYRNIYCAICHGAKNASTWSTEIITDTITRMDTDESKNILLLSNEPNTSPNCSKNYFPAQMNKILFCSTTKTEEFGHSHRGRSSFGEDHHTKASVFPLSFQVIMNFGFNGKGHIFFSATPQIETSPTVHKCAENEIYVQNVEKCRKIVCASGHKLVNSKCQATTDTSDGESSSLDNLDSLNHDEEASQITLRLNVTEQDLLVLRQEDSDKSIVAEFCTMLNISSDRIKNFTIEYQNGTVSGKTLEVHPFVTPKPIRKNKARPLDPNEEPTISNDGSAHDNGDSQLDTNGERTESYGVDLDSKKMPYNTLQETYTVIIKFIIFPARKKSSKDVPTSLVIDTMKSMIYRKSFSFSLNGTSFNVDDVDNFDPLILDSWCTKGRINYYWGDDFELTSRHSNETGQMRSAIYVNSTNTFYDQKQFDLYVMLTTTLGDVSNVNKSSYVFVCDMPRIVDKECGRIEIVDSEYSRFPENNSILYSGELMSMNNYEYVNDTSDSLRLCAPKEYVSGHNNLLVQSCGVHFYQVILAENYLSFTLGIVSLVAMVSVLVTYYLFDSLRNLPGLNTINLTVSLFLGELLFLLSGLVVKHGIDWLCKAIAVSLHYLFLASFFWMNVMAYDLYRTFGHKCILTRVREKKNFFRRYFIYAWGSPALIVCACAFIDFSNLLEGVRIGYGSYVEKNTDNILAGNVLSTPSTNRSGEHNDSDPIISPNSPSNSFTEANLGCWIMEPVATLATFGLPMIIILGANAIMFIKTIICIRDVAKLAKHKTRRSSLNQAVGKSDVVLYVRMSTVMGFTWIIGLASSIISAFADGPTDTMCIVLHTIGILFIVFNCSQGVFIFGAFVFNQRVLGLYKSKIKTWRETDRRKTYFRSTSTLSSSVKY
ncbi:uncharacterized protein LOC110452384 [Mizuhopecten yessoensis]|uniref:G-protein coupled receptor Mth2 n=1 Tax=Mizuhopecten yessoensis TaxID=6573 RepID=A0A210R4V0_MIZYE|nr:uncharacterized protein LOC110452384 [Mizuhopecten yessoensis]OWF56042.1 G-protein coupled receptor Mth2 [Mizuhopecten yessoensis]